jgi:hypothetical protein
MRWKMMTPEQRGAYWQLICWQMQSDDGHLSADVAQLSRLADVDLSGANACVMDAFPMNGNGRRANPRALKEWEKRQAISGKRSAAGTKGMASRYHKARQPDNKPITSVTTSTSTSTGEQPEAQTPPLPPDGGSGLPEFDEFWEAYPNKTGKQAAVTAWRKAKRKPNVAVILSAIEQQKRGPKWTKDGGQYIPHPGELLGHLHHQFLVRGAVCPPYPRFG